MVMHSLSCEEPDEHEMCRAHDVLIESGHIAKNAARSLLSALEKRPVQRGFRVNLGGPHFALQ